MQISINGTHKSTILYVEDDESTREIITLLVSKKIPDAT